VGVGDEDLLQPPEEAATVVVPVPVVVRVGVVVRMGVVVPVVVPLVVGVRVVMLVVRCPVGVRLAHPVCSSPRLVARQQPETGPVTANLRVYVDSREGCARAARLSANVV
jgi:hypothetical protein